MPTDTRTALLSHALIGYEERRTEISETIARIRATLDGKATATQSRDGLSTAAAMAGDMQSPAKWLRMEGEVCLWWQPLVSREQS